MSTDNTGKRIAKNTLALYFRMFFLLLVSLYTNRVVLAELGASDFGIYSVLYGLMVIISFFTTAIANATQRFLNVELGKGSTLSNLRKVFSATVAINILLAVVLFVLGETLGLWFVNTQMNFDPDRMTAVNWVYQFLVGNWVVGVISAPYYSAIITHERMDIFAGFSVLEAVIKLLFVFALPFIHWHQLELFTFMVFFISCVLAVCYVVFSRRHFEESRQIDWHFDWSIVRRMLGFTSWTVLGVCTTSFQVQGVAILVNLFFGTIVNAAFGIAMQVNGVVKRFVQSFLTAFNPHIVKTYAADQLDEMHLYIIRGCRIAIVLVAMFVIPLMIETPTVLTLWLNKVPDQTVVFVRFILLAMLIDCSSELLTTAVGSTGQVKWYNIVLSLFGILQLIITWVLYHYGYASYTAMYVYLSMIVVMLIVRFYFTSIEVSLSMRRVFTDILLRSIFFILIAASLPCWLHLFLEGQGLFKLLIVSSSSIVSILVSAWLIMAASSERQMIIQLIRKKLGKTD